MEVRLYGDESGDRNNKVLAIGGIIGFSDHLDAFQDAWITRVKPTGVSSYHMTDCECGYGEFSENRGWTKQDRDQLTKDLIDLICEHEVFIIGTGVLLDDYNRLPPINDEGVLFGGSPWHLCFGQIIYEACKRIGDEAPPEWGISCFFDWKEKKGLAESIYEYTQQDERLQSWHKRLGPLTFGHKEFDVPDSIPLLQAADIAAVETRKRIGNPLTRPDLRIRQSYQRLVDCGKIWATKYFTYPVMDVMFQMKRQSLGLSHDLEAAKIRLAESKINETLAPLNQLT